MSFILDALKKSESERNRQTGPTLLEVRVAPPRSRLPLWAIVHRAGGTGQRAVLGYLLLRPAPPAPAYPPIGAGCHCRAHATPPQRATRHRGPTCNRRVLPDPSQPVTTPLPAPRAVQRPPMTALITSPLSPCIHRPGLLSQQAERRRRHGSSHAQRSQCEWRQPARAATEPACLRRGPARRYVLLNSTRLREGESTPDGIRLERITEVRRHSIVAQSPFYSAARRVSASPVEAERRPFVHRQRAKLACRTQSTANSSPAPPIPACPQPRATARAPAGEQAQPDATPAMCQLHI